MNPATTQTAPQADPRLVNVFPQKPLLVDDNLYNPPPTGYTYCRIDEKRKESSNFMKRERVSIAVHQLVF